MNGIILINKPTGYTSRDIVNIVGKRLSTKKIGHTGTLDPLATGVLVLCVGKYTKLVDLITSYDKEYIAEVILGLETDTLDIEGNIIKEVNVNNIEKNIIIEALNHFKGKYLQEVPAYSAVKINGKKLYEYARNNIEIQLPKREVIIKEIELIDNITFEKNKLIFKFKTSVSKGTYIRSLIRDIGEYLKVPATMKNLTRTRQGNFKLEDCNELENEYKILSIEEVINLPIIDVVDEKLKKQILNGAKIDNIYNKEMIMFKINNEIVGIYHNDNDILKPYKMLI
ncbi:MAG: tRNA pseudouridine(55) synthase TruB [Bacilli bacterium]|nr:tRNA pseudouridine(55) synthase TruB [Bacilli bacterium]